MIDWNQVKQLEDDIGAEDFGDIVEVFIEEVDEAVAALRDKTEMTNTELGPALHFLKGSAANLGFVDFASYCSDGEVLADAGNGHEVNLKQVVSLYDQSKSVFLSGVPDHTSYTP